MPVLLVVGLCMSYANSLQDSSCMKKSLIALTICSLLYICLELGLQSILQNPKTSSLALSTLYSWLPGFVAIFYARKEKIKLPIFKKPNRYFFIALLLGFGFCILATTFTNFFDSTPLDQTNWQRPGMIKIGVITYPISLLIFFIGFLGGELYWRGYFWEKLKKAPYRAIWLTILISTLWLASMNLLNTQTGNLLKNLVLISALNIAITPLLFYFRVKGKSIQTPTLFYSSIFATTQALTVLFQTPGFNSDTYFFSLIALCIVPSLLLNLYRPTFWKTP